MSRLSQFTNPVHHSNTPDPFVFKYAGSYWCYCTGWATDGNCFPTLTSDDLVHWKELGGAMKPLAEKHPEYWAPEVCIWHGSFYLYYSVGDGSLMQIRVAISDDPGGPFQDCGVRLTSQDFAIDPHVFRDDDGSRWLFYATDFLEHTHIGTGTVRDRLSDPHKLAGSPRPVVRARYDWQLFDPARQEKGGARWHTVEGPAVLKHNGVYYEMFSGGNWKNDTYGVGYAVTADIEDDNEWLQVSDGIHVHPILRTVPGVTGPGHNSVVRGPDNRRLYCVYHRWSEDRTSRLMAIDPLEFVGRDLAVFGPTNTPQPLPNKPRRLNWTTESGDWTEEHGRIVQHSIADRCETLHAGPLEKDFLLECSARMLGSSTDGRIGISVYDTAGEQRHVVLPDSRTEFNIFRLLRLEACGETLLLSDDSGRRETIRLNAPVRTIGLCTFNTAAEFAGIEFTAGWQTDFAEDDRLPDRFHGNNEDWQLEAMELVHRAKSSPGAIFRNVPSAPYEFTVNVRIGETSDGFYGFFPAASIDVSGPLIAILSRGVTVVIVVDGSGGRSLHNAIPLAVMPSRFDRKRYEQFTMIVNAASISVLWRGQFMCEAPSVPGERVGLFASGEAFVDMIRVTQLTDASAS